MLFGAGALGIVSELALLENALPNVTGNLTALCRLVGEQILVVVFVEHILDVELLAVGQLGANLTRVDNLLVDVELGGLRSGELCLRPLLVEVCLFRVAERPQGIELHLDLRHFIHFAGANASLEDDRQQVTQVLLHHALLDALQIVVPVFQIGVAGGVHACRRTAKKDSLRNRGQRRQEVAGRVDDVGDAAELELPEVVVLAFAINGNAVQQAAGHVNRLQTAQDSVLALFGSKLCGQILHLVDRLNGAVEQLRCAAVGHFCVTDGPVDSHILGDAP